MPRRAVGLLLGAMLILIPAVPRADEKPKQDKDKKVEAGAKEKDKDKKDKDKDKEKDKEKKKPRKDRPKDQPAPGGIWKVTLPTLRGAGTDPVWLLDLDKDGDKWTGEVLDTRQRWPKASVEKLKVSADKVQFHLKTAELPALVCSFALPKGKATKMRGTYALQRRHQPIEMERTTLTSLDPAEVMKDKLANQEDGAEAVLLALPLLGQAEDSKATAAEVRSWSDKAIRSAGLYGKDWQREVLLIVAEILAGQKGHEGAALRYARQAEKMLTAQDSVGEQQRVLGMLADVLEKAGKDADAKAIRVKLSKLDIRVKVKPFAGRKAKSQRVVLVELFTNAMVQPCLAGDLAFDALGRSFKTSEVVLLQYHLNLPQTRYDPLTSPAGDARADFYEKVVEGAPTIIFNGKVGPEGGGGIDEAPEKYEEYAKAVTPLLETAEKADLKLSATRVKDKVTINAEVAKLSQTGDDVRLRVVLVEREVLYKGGNGLTRYNHVVRDMPGGDAGTILKTKALKKSFTVDVAGLKKKLKDYHDKRTAKGPVPEKAAAPLDLKNLRVIAFVQNDKSGEVLQAVQAEVTEGKEEVKEEKKGKDKKGKDKDE